MAWLKDTFRSDFLIFRCLGIWRLLGYCDTTRRPLVTISDRSDRIRPESQHRPYSDPMTKQVVSLLLLCAAAWAQIPAPSFHVDIVGKGKPMILIPGFASSGKTWDSTV